MDAIKLDGSPLPRWSLGGGTVLMFYYAHRKSKDIDIFVPDPQFLGYVNPRLGGRGEEVTTAYKEGTEFVKLFLPEGEIDFVASATLTENPFEEHEVLGRNILLETPIEIVAKKLWYRGDRATPRDLLDLALVIEHHYSEILDHSDVFSKNIEAFTNQCASRRAIMQPVFDEIEKIEFKLSFDDCLDRANSLKADMHMRRESTVANRDALYPMAKAQSDKEHLPPFKPRIQKSEETNCCKTCGMNPCVCGAPPKG